MASLTASDLRDEYRLVIDGEQKGAVSGETFTTVDPSTGEAIAQIARGENQDIDQAVAAAKTAQLLWSSKDPRERGSILTDIADELAKQQDSLAELTTLENGKPLSESFGEAGGCAEAFRYYAGIADKVHGEQIPRGDNYVDFTYREPHGTTAHIIPWNFPLNIFARSVAVALATGNTAVVKPAEQTSIGAIRIAEIAHEAGLPDGVLNVVTGLGEEAGAPLTGHDDINHVTFTGSVETGKTVANLAADQITPVSLELGGKSPNVVFPDADIDVALDNAVSALFTMVSGQCCSAGDRLIIHEDVYNEFLDRLADRLDDVNIGPGLEDPDMGPMVDESQYEKVTKYIDIGKQEVGEPFYGGNELDQDGYFIQPTIFKDVDNESRIAQEEIFGPVLVAMPFANEAEAVELANNSNYGLTAGIFTNDFNRAHRFARDVNAGGVYINEWFAEGIETPFGGYKDSGIGRERGVEAVEHYTQTKNICANLDP